VVLGLIQGTTEFLPVSSSGHLVLAQRLFGVRSPGIVLEVTLHVATTAAVLVYFRRRLLDIFRTAAGPAGWRRFLALIIVASLPAALVGLFFEEAVTGLFENGRAVGWSLLFTAAVLGASFLIRRRAQAIAALSWGGALVIGVAQAIAVAPGVSRAGMTVVAALLVGLAGAEAATFSFLLSVPAVLGAAALELRHAPTFAGDWTGVGVAAAVALVAAWGAIYLVVATARSRHFGWFGVYCAVVGLLALVAIR